MRPRVVIPERVLRSLYLDERMSLLAVAQRLGVSRHVVRARLLDLGISIRSYDAAMDLQRYIGPAQAEPRCPFPRCDSGAGCAQHGRAVRAAAKQRGCAWPGCQSSGDGWCTYHGKVMAGLIEVPQHG